jgi:hypothetical protein
MLKNSQPLKSSIVGIFIIACTMGMLSGCGEKASTPAKPQQSWIDTNPVIQSFLTDLGKWNTTNKHRLQIEFGWIYTPHFEKPSHTKQSPIPAPYLTQALTELMTDALNLTKNRRIHPETSNRLFERNPRRGKSELVTAGTVRHYKPSIVDSATQLTLAQWVQHKQQSHGLKSVLPTYEPTEPVTFGQFCQWATVLMNLHKPTVNPQDTTVAEENAPLSNELQDYFQAYQALRQAQLLPALTSETKVIDLLQQPMSRVDLLLLAIPLTKQSKAFQGAWHNGVDLPPYYEDWQPANASPLETIDQLANWEALPESHQAVMAWAYQQGWLAQWFGFDAKTLDSTQTNATKTEFPMQAVLTQAETFACLRTLAQ